MFGNFQFWDIKCLIEYAVYNLAPRTAHSIMLTGSKKKQSFKTPLINKISFPYETSMIKKFNDIDIDHYDNSLILRRLSKYCYYQTVIANFQPKESEPENYLLDKHGKVKLQDCTAEKWHAVFNNDKRYFTPAFVVGKDLKDYQYYPRYDLDKFNEKLLDARNKIEEEGKKKSQILCPKPGSLKCQICKCEFKEYIQHIKQENHLKLFRSSEGWKYINEFIEDFKKKQKQTAPMISKSKIKQKIQPVYQPRRVKQSFKTKLITKKIPANYKLLAQKMKLSGISSTYITVCKDETDLKIL